MDAPDFSGEELTESFRFIRFVNLLGGGRRVVVNELRRLVKTWPREQPLELLDVGCGAGDMARGLQSWAQAQGVRLRYSGLERSPHILAFARRSVAGPDIRFISGDLFDDDLPPADIITASMIFHHLDAPEVVQAIRHLVSRARVALLINDLERSWFAYLAGWLLSSMIHCPKARADALLSVRRGFTPGEMRDLLQQAGVKGSVRQALGFRVTAVIPGSSVHVKGSFRHRFAG
jgi:SAM-dependent methyltransferase